MAEWPERAETHPFAAEEESELGYMDDSYQEEPFEELLSPEFISSERDTLWMVEVLQPACSSWKYYIYRCTDCVKMSRNPSPISELDPPIVILADTDTIFL